MKKIVLSVLVIMLSVVSSNAIVMDVEVYQNKSIVMSAIEVKDASNYVYNKKVETKYSEELTFLDTKFKDAIDKYDGENYPTLLLANFDTSFLSVEFRYDLISFNNIVDTIMIRTKDKEHLMNTELYTYLVKKGYEIYSKSLKIVKKSVSDKVQEDLKKFDGFNCEKGNNFRIVEPDADKYLIDFKSTHTDIEYQNKLIIVKEDVCSSYSFTQRSARASYNQIIVEDNEYDKFIKLNKGLKTFTYIQISIPQ